MAKVATQIGLRSQNADSAVYLFERINELLAIEDLERFRIAVAYARWDGLGLFSKQLESFMDAGGEFQAIYGVANGVTTPDALLYSLYLKELYTSHTYAGAVEDKYADAIFHPKLFEFRFCDRTILIVGSANLTGGGLLRNTELVAELEVPHGDPTEAAAEDAWKAVKAASMPITLNRIRDLKKADELADETEDGGEGKSTKSKPRLQIKKPVAAKPLFAKVLDIPQPKRRVELLSKLDPVSERPKRLYLQILETETGGSSDGTRAGYQVQLPVAALAAYFGVAENETREAGFQFPRERVVVHLTHFGNNTHRVRLRPILDVTRPCIVIFNRHGNDEYRCDFVPAKDYARVLASKCTEQTRAGARKWGIE